MEKNMKLEEFCKYLLETYPKSAKILIVENLYDEGGCYHDTVSVDIDNTDHIEFDKQTNVLTIGSV